MMRDSLLAFHVTVGAGALVLGPFAIRGVLRAGAQTRADAAYHALVIAVCASAIGLAAFGWSRLWWLVPIALASYSFALRAQLAVSRAPAGWRREYIAGQGGSYVALITAVLVVSLADITPLVWALP